MSQPLGRSVRLFLVDGKATGLITAEIMNWTGHVLAGQRADLPRFLARPEVGRTGIYLLYGPDPDAPDQLMLYIGESDQVGQRLKQHNQDDNKLYWERACVVTSKDGSRRHEIAAPATLAAATGEPHVQSHHSQHR